ncbi:isochorismate synthase [Flavobacterium terrigena]|uniref:isochorismate synthase n=1 Tax=Flavobacterium terrigena TaxID=402734 RepID=A0A1H6Y8A1_9FLAO|nr:isochorismate synthase [Flavobacterium terrigena]SEJ35267.1 isochorismate synthase [Flavobacterium terrigena]
MKLLDKVLSHFQNQLPFVVYAKPNEEILHGIFQNNATLNVFENQKGFVFASFYNETNVVFPISDSEVFQEEINLEIEENPIQIESKSDENARVSFENLVRNGVSEIEKGIFEKVVLSRKIDISQPIDFIKSYQNLLKKYPTAFRYLWFHPKVGMWMGATPEQLAKIENNTFETVALAGTQVYSETVSWQEKEIVEQQLVTDYIKSRTENLVESLQISESYTQKAGNLVHLKSDISGKLKQNVSELEVINALHPTSAVCGMPLKVARNFLLENEKYNRKYYAGFLGEFQMQEQTNLFVNLRCCEIENTITTIYVGCGITKDSQANKEFIETENKAKTVLSILVAK